MSYLKAIFEIANAIDEMDVLGDANRAHEVEDQDQGFGECMTLMDQNTEQRYERARYSIGNEDDHEDVRFGRSRFSTEPDQKVKAGRERKEREREMRISDASDECFCVLSGNTTIDAKFEPSNKNKLQIVMGICRESTEMVDSMRIHGHESFFLDIIINKGGSFFSFFAFFLMMVVLRKSENRLKMVENTVNHHQ